MRGSTIVLPCFVAAALAASCTGHDGWGPSVCEDYTIVSFDTSQVAGIDCTITIVGVTHTAIYDFPAANPTDAAPPPLATTAACSDPGSLADDGVCTVLSGPPSGLCVRSVTCAYLEFDGTALRDFLGGPNFTVTFACGGETIIDRQSQSIGCNYPS
jgi:hypothetical protein